MATGSYLTPNYSRSQSEIQGDLHKMSIRKIKLLHRSEYNMSERNNMPNEVKGTAKRELTHSLMFYDTHFRQILLSSCKKLFLWTNRRNHEEPPMTLTPPLYHFSHPIRTPVTTFHQERTFSQVFHLKALLMLDRGRRIIYDPYLHDVNRNSKKKLEVKLLTSALKAFQCNNCIVMAQKKHLDDFLRGRIIGRLECRRTQLEVSEELGIAQSVISRLWQRFQDDGNVSRCYSTGRPRVTMPNEDRYIWQLLPNETDGAQRQTCFVCSLQLPVQQFQGKPCTDA
ncbi:uncharacterized protein TNCV_4559931 [Trichonephila clavipes]|nr:uncharacterized protein TNCV_4559931 [Trichonephila clavipes]